MSNANEQSRRDRSLTCIVCKVTMKIANSTPDADGRDLVQYHCCNYATELS